jgi:hypothetical protein
MMLVLTIPLLFLYTDSGDIVLSFLFLINIVFVLGEELEDYPESPGSPSAITGEAASRLLDADDSPMDSAGTSSGVRATPTATAGGHVPSQKRQYSGGSENTEPPAPSAGLNLPPIYFSVQRKKLNKTVVRHLDGGATSATEGTISGAPVSSHSSIGSFANSGDHRSIEGTDVGQDNPPVFVLADQNFPPMVPVGGMGNVSRLFRLKMLH